MFGGTFEKLCRILYFFFQIKNSCFFKFVKIKEENTFIGRTNFDLTRDNHALRLPYPRKHFRG